MGDFPAGMRVLAVDDDPVCLILLGGMLRKCHYHVTTTNQARVALDMLRKNKDRFDLVISDVHMPDMDGFKLLEQVGLEMDLPVIMMSANSDPSLVMRGVTHGACDYLVKPVRLEELRNIWQHVIRKKKLNPDSHNKTSGKNKSHPGRNGKINKKRKDDDNGGDESESDNDVPASQKKPRVVWTTDLHAKFVAAVNRLGIENATPKRIHDLMNVEGLTRVNVASHLQKYRLCLKRISLNATQQTNLVSGLGSKDAYMRRGSGSGRLSSTIPSPYTSSCMLSRLNSSTGMSLQNLASSVIIRPSHGHLSLGQTNFNRRISMPLVGQSSNGGAATLFHQGETRRLSTDSNFNHKRNYSENSDNILSILNSRIPANHGNPSLGQTNFNRQISMPLVGQSSNGGAATLFHKGETRKLSADPKMKSDSEQHGALTAETYDFYVDKNSSVVKLEPVKRE